MPKIDLKDRSLVAARIKQAVRNYYTRKKRAVNEELVLKKRPRLRADLYITAFNWYTVIAEVKSCPADFRADNKTGKWRGYLDYCNQFYWAVTQSTYTKIKDDIEPGCGVLIVDVDKLTVKVKKKAKRSSYDLHADKDLAIRILFRNADHTRLKRKRKADKG